MPKITLSRAEAADALSVDIQTIDNMIADGATSGVEAWPSRRLRGGGMNKRTPEALRRDQPR
jgi:hypothetical protein